MLLQSNREKNLLRLFYSVFGAFPLTNLVVPAGHVQGCPPIRVPELQVQPGTLQQLTSIIIMIVMMMMMRVTWVQMITWLLVMASLRGSPPRQFTSAPSRNSLWNWAKSP